MTFLNEKRMFLAKQDKSKKGTIDPQIKPLLDLINAHPQYYTTSSCSGRVYLWRGSGKKNETEWIKVSHERITEDFLKINPAASSGLIWLRVEPFILHVACRDLEAANSFLEKARPTHKKSCILSISNKILLEIRGSEFIEMPLWKDNKPVYAGDVSWLAEAVNEKLNLIRKGTEHFHHRLEKQERAKA